MIRSAAPSFGRWRTFLWPIHKYELRKFLPLLLMSFFITFNYNILRNLKDSLVITAAESGAEVIPFIKVWVLLPMAFAVTFLFTRLVNRFSREQVFYLLMSSFLGFFILFTFILYPLRDWLHPQAFAEFLRTVLPVGMKGFIAMVQNWTFTGFYVAAELWGNIVLAVLFWGFANEVTRVNEAKRFYGLIGIGANFSGIAAGQLSILVSPSHYNSWLPFGKDAWDQALILSTIAVLTSGMVIIVIFRWLNTRVIHAEEHARAPSVQSTKKEKVKLSMRQNFLYLARSRYLLAIAVIVLCYNIVINLTEVLWKAQVRELYPQANDYYSFMGQISMITGTIATLTALFVSGNIIRKWGWTFAALIPPTIILVTSVGFFACLLFKLQLSPFLALSGLSPLLLAVFFGSTLNCLSRASKYSLFDATKELSFIPLDRDSKIKGKAVIDGVGSRLGKSGGSIFYQGLMIFFGGLTATTPYVSIFLLTVIVLWIIAVRALGKRFTSLVAQQENLSLEKSDDALVPSVNKEQSAAVVSG